MNWSKHTTSEEFFKFMNDNFYIKTEGIKLLKLEDEETLLFQIISEKAFAMDWIMRLGIVKYNPNFNANNNGNLLITFIVNK